MESSVRPSDKAPAMIHFHLRMIWKVDMRVWNQSTAVQAILFIVTFPIMRPRQDLSDDFPAMAWLDLVQNDLAEVLAKHWWPLFLGYRIGNTRKPRMYVIAFMASFKVIEPFPCENHVSPKSRKHRSQKSLFGDLWF